MIYSKKDQLKDLEKLDDLQSKLKQDRLAEKLGIQGCHYDLKRVIPTDYKNNNRCNTKMTWEK